MLKEQQIIFKSHKIFLHNRSEQYCKIAIIGAGMAGLGAAKTLVDNGINDFVILEAMDKPGGRIHTIKLNGSCIELGAQWLHSTTVSLHEIANEKGLIHETYSDEGKGIYIRDDGFIYNELLVKKVDFKFGEILEECEDFINATNYPKSVGNFLEDKFLIYINEVDDSDDIKQQKLELFDWNLLFQIIDNSCNDMKHVSSKQWGHYLCLGKDGQGHINLKGGYHQLIKVLLDKLPFGVVKLSKAVENIDYSSQKIRVFCKDTTVYNVDHVICTSSLGFLKENARDFFTPPLPEKLVKTINLMGFCGIAKVFLVFDERWWGVDGFQLVWRRGSFVEEEEAWTKFITGFDSVLEQDNVLLGWVGGAGVEIMEKLPEKTVGVHCVKLLRRFLKRDDVPFPRQVFKSGWLTCPYIKGGYSHSTPECDQAGVGPLDLCEPVYRNDVPKILLAGEANHPNFFSTTHGAFQSGQDQAKRLLPYLK